MEKILPQLFKRGLVVIIIKYQKNELLVLTLSVSSIFDKLIRFSTTFKCHIQRQ